MIKQIFTIVIIFYAIVFFSGCTANLTDPEIDFEPPKYVEQMPSKEEGQDFTSTGSIFGQGDNPLFSDHKAMHVNDIVRVVIAETAQSSNVAAKAISESDTSTLGGGTFTALPDNQFATDRADKLGFYGFLEEGRVCIDARSIVGIFLDL